MRTITIKQIKFRNILNSNGDRAIEVEMKSNNEITGIASAASAIISGKREKKELRTLDNKYIDDLINEIYCTNFLNQKQFDDILKKYINNVGTSICLTLSLSFARIMAQEQKILLIEYITKLTEYTNKKIMPNLLIAIFAGGVHSSLNYGSIQNIMISVNKKLFSEALKIVLEVYTYIESELKKKNVLKGYSSSSGMIVENMANTEKFEMLTNTIKKLNYNNEVTIGIDVAAEHFYKNEKYNYEGDNLSSNQMNKIIQEYINKYNITYIEDPFDSDDINAWIKLKKDNPNKIIVGDDLTATQEKYINSNLANGIVIKLNQVGTLTDTINAIKKARTEKIKICVSHRSIETEDTFMCDLAVALDADYIKIGGPRRGDRIAKYNRLLRLEEILYN